ncbi:MAG TPA: phytoene desaturase family protein [Thermoleophilaceae bacterium]|jgi:phytoene desaturase
MAPSAVIVGAGLGGLSTAVRLAAQGWRVRVFDKNSEPGGRMSTVQAGGFSWDCGPTLIMMPEVLRELWAAADRRLEDDLELTRVDPYYRVVFAEGGHLDLTGDLPRLVQNVEAIEPGGGARVLGFLAAAERLMSRTRLPIIERTFAGRTDLARPAVLRALLRARPLASVASVAAEHFRSDALRQAFTFQTLYLGTHPAAAPAAYVMIPFVEAALGVWYPMGGVHRIAQAMAHLAEKVGAEIELETPVAQILTEGRRAAGVALAEGRRVRADVVVSNADWGHTQRALLHRSERIGRRDWGASGVLFLLAVRGPLAGPHHQFLLAGDFRGNLADIFEHRRLPRDPSIYVSRPTATDPSRAPAGTELLYVLVPTPTLDSEVDWAAELPAFRERVLARLARGGFPDLSGRILAETTLTPESFGLRYNLSHGAAFGLAATLLQSGPFRPSIRSRRYAGLYHVGASVHPGGGVPIVTTAGRMVAEAIVQDHGNPRTRAAAGTHEPECPQSASS